MSITPPTDDSDDVSAPISGSEFGPTVALDLLLLSLARTQSRLGAVNEDAHRVIEALRREWSETYRVQMSP